MVKLFYYFALSITLLLAAPFSEAATHLWLPPYYVQLPYAAKLSTVNSPDSVIIQARSTAGKTLFLDYGLRHTLSLEAYQPLEDKAETKLRCRTFQANQMQAIECLDWSNTDWVITLRIPSSEKASDLLFSLAKTLQPVGDPTRVKVLWAHQRTQRAKIVDESGAARVIKPASLVLPQLGRVKTISNGEITVEKFTQNALGEFVRSEIILR